ncbi:MAG: hypothetical protein ACE5FN_07380 [Leptospirillia bacterium]
MAFPALCAVVSGSATLKALCGIPALADQVRRVVDAGEVSG